MPSAPQDIYARLLSSPRGYPLWTPEPSNELLMERREGLRIGDVGVVLDDGGFDILFNLCLPADHPFHLRHGVPDGFTFINPGLLDIRTVPNSERPGRILSSSSVMRDESAEDVTKRHDSLYRFNLSSSEGALLILPDGAERYDLLSEHLFLEQAKLHGAAWYHYAVNRRHRLISPDALYLITGMHKTRAWSVAAFENTTADHTAYFKKIQSAGTDETTYTWETTCCALDWRVGPYVDHGIPNQAVFIRGLKIALRSGFLGTRWISVEADAPSTRFTPVKSTSIVPSNSPVLSTLAGFFGRTGSSVFQATRHNEGPTVEDVPQTSGAREGYDGMYVSVERVPNIPPAIHPSDAINRYLLAKDPSANIAITSDSVWISLLETESITPQDLGDEAHLEVLLSDRYRIVSRQGAAFLEKRPTESVAACSSAMSEPGATASTSTGDTPSLDTLDLHTESKLTNVVTLLNSSVYMGWRSMSTSTPLSRWGLNAPSGARSYPQPIMDPAASFEPPDALNDSSEEYSPPQTPTVMLDHQVHTRGKTQSLSLSDRESKMCVCQWMTNGSPCGDRVRRQKFSAHFNTVHGIPPPGTVQCSWIDCGKEMSTFSLPLHIQEKHLELSKYRCIPCDRLFTRRSVLMAHNATVHGHEPISRDALQPPTVFH